jgi:hypothetical protein
MFTSPSLVEQEAKAAWSGNAHILARTAHHLPINPPFPGVGSPKLSLVHPYLLPVPITLDRVDNMGKHQDTTQGKTSTGATIIASLPPVKSRDWHSQDDSGANVNESTAPNFRPGPVYAKFTLHRLIFHWVLALGRRPVDHYGQRSLVIFPAQTFTAFMQCFSRLPLPLKWDHRAYATSYLYITIILVARPLWSVRFIWVCLNYLYRASMDVEDFACLDVTTQLE